MELRGNLKDFSLPDVIQLVGFGRKNGVLRVDCGGSGAALYFELGNVVHAEYPGVSGQDAVFALFGVAEGEFRFQPNVEPPQRTITMDPTNLVMEAARVHDEARRDAAEDGGAVVEDGDGEDWFALGPAPREPREIKQEIKALLGQRFGRNAKRLLQAVDRCGDSSEEFLDLAERVEKYVHVFLDSSSSLDVGRQIRNIISSPPSS